MAWRSGFGYPAVHAARLDSGILGRPLMKAFLAIVLLLCAPMALATDNLKAFPAAEEGMVRYVINVPVQQNEADLRVELLVGKTVTTDAANRYFFGGQLETETLQGWGFDRYVLRKLGPMAGTLMAVDPNAPEVERFVTAGGEPKLLRYNSRLPLVVYVPTGVEVRYRYWHAEEVFVRADPG